MRKKVLITGATGFVGANLVRRLLQGSFELHLLVRPESDLWRIQDLLPYLFLHRVELENLALLAKLAKEISPAAIFHLAATGASSMQQVPQRIFMSNILGTFNLLKATEELRYEFFAHVGGSSEYGNPGRAMCEDTLPQPTTFYGVSKACSTLIAQQFSHTTQKPIALLRLFSVYGSLEAPNRFIPTAIAAAVQGKPLRLTPPGYARDFVFVEDVIDALLLTWEKGVVREILNIGTGVQTKNEEVVTILEEIVGKKITIAQEPFPPKLSDKTVWVADSSKAKKLLGWQARHSLKEGLQKLVGAHVH